MVTQTQLIKAEDFLPYRGLSANMDTAKRLDGHVLEAQKMDLAPLLGSRLYYDLLKYTASLRAGRASTETYVPTDEEILFERLLNGVEYTIHAGTNKEVTVMYEGIVPVLVYFTFARFVIRDNIRSTPSGFVYKKTLESEPISQKVMQQEADRAEADARVYMQSVRNYISDQRYILDGDAEFFKRYGNDCCGGGVDNGCGCSSGKSNRVHMKGIKRNDYKTKRFRRF